MKNFYPKIALLFLLFTFSISAQETCTEFKQTSAILLNLQLGMTSQEVSNKLGKKLGINIKKEKDYRFFQNYVNNKKPPQNLTGVRAFYLRFFEKKLYQIEIFFDENKFPSDIKNFSEIASTQLNLPAENWKIAHRQAIFTCGETSLEIDYQLNPRVELTDEKIVKQVDEINKKTKLF